MPREIEPGKLPPSSCRECQIAPFTIYGPTIREAPNKICQLRCETRKVSAGRTLTREGDIPQKIHVIYSGWALYYKQLSDGRRQIASFLLPGDTLMLEAICFPRLPAPFSVKALTDVAICGFTTTDMITLLHGSDAQERKFSRARHQLLRFLHSRLFDLGRRSARGRLAQLVLELCERLKTRGMMADDGSFNFPPRQEHLADALGITTVHVNRTLAQLRREGVFSIEGGRLSVHDEEALRQIAHEE